jgi:endo-1,4-beta-xylanase
MHTSAQSAFTHPRSLSRLLIVSALAAFSGLAAQAALPLTGKIDPPTNPDNKYLGCISQINSTGQTVFPNYWTQLTTENACKWKELQPNSATFDVNKKARMVAAMDIAQARGIPFKFHAILWGRSIPAWAIQNSTSQTVFQETLRTYIQSLAVPATIGGVPAYIDVVNEPFGAPIEASWGALAPIPGYGQHLSDQQVSNLSVFAFQVARNNFPNSKLLLNEFNVMTVADRRAEFIVLAKRLKSLNLLDGIGLQFHWFETLKTQNAASINATLNELTTQIGVPIHISELSVNGLFWNSDYSGLIDDTSPTATAESIQRNRLITIFPTLWNHPNVKGITLWSYHSALAFDYNQQMANGTQIGVKGIGLTKNPGVNESEKLGMTWIRDWFQTKYPGYTPVQ